MRWFSLSAKTPLSILFFVILSRKSHFLYIIHEKCDLLVMAWKSYFLYIIHEGGLPVRSFGPSVKIVLFIYNSWKVRSFGHGVKIVLFIYNSWRGPPARSFGHGVKIQLLTRHLEISDQHDRYAGSAPYVADTTLNIGNPIIMVAFLKLNPDCEIVENTCEFPIFVEKIV